MKSWLKVEVLGGALTSLALAMLALGIVLAEPAEVFADDGGGTATPITSLCGICDNTICVKNVPGSCGDATNGTPCPFDFTCLCNCITVTDVEGNKSCDCASS